MVVLLTFEPCLGVSSPAANRLTVAEVYDKTGKPRPEVLKKHFIQEGRVEEDVALRIIADGEFDGGLVKGGEEGGRGGEGGGREGGRRE